MSGSRSDATREGGSEPRFPDTWLTLPPEKLVQKLIWEGVRLLDEDRQKEREDRPTELYPYISEAGKHCDRAVALRLAGTERTDEPTEDEKVTFYVGHAFEEMMQKVFERIGARVIAEGVVDIPNQDSKVRGRYDFFIHLPYLKTFLELKTTTINTYRRYQETDGALDHRSQLNLYGYAAKHGHLVDEPLEVDHLVLVYFLKDVRRRDREDYTYARGSRDGKYKSGETKPGIMAVQAHHVPYDEQQAKKDLRLLRLSEQRARYGDVPEIPSGFTPDAFPCGWCGFRTHCWGGEG